MPNVSIVTDSAADLDPETIKRLNIHVLPLNVRLGSETFREGVDITSEQFLTRLRQAGGFPSVTPPSVSEFHRLYEELSNVSADILSLHVSSRLERVCDVARKAAGSFLGRGKIEVMDSEATSRAQGILVTAAAEAAQAGASIDEIVRLVRGMIPHVYAIFFVDTLDYLEHDGRIGVAQATLGTMLNIKALLTIEDGDIIPMEKVRTDEKGIEKLVEFIAEFSNVEELLILQDRQPLQTDDLLARLALLFPEREIPVLTYGPSLAAHVGPAALGAVIYEGV